jgi:CrcB protein
VQKYLLIALGGALGSIARYWVGSTIAGRMGTRFPFGTFVVNITACIIIGFSLTYLGRRAGLSPAWRFLIPVGFIGAYSTFSGLCDGVVLRTWEPDSGPGSHLVRGGAG